MHEKAYKNLDFLNSPAARLIRIQCEYSEPEDRFRRLGVEDTIVMYGSARTLSTQVAALRHKDAVAALAKATKANKAELEAEVKIAEGKMANSRYYDETRELAQRLTRWGMTRPGGREYLIATGGGPGIMEAGNRGASDVEGGRSVGLGISLPFEERLNQYVTKELGFVFHYFFMRKYWLMYLAKAMIVLPGGFGTLDELFELLTLRQTGKVTKQLPIVLYGKAYWDKVLNLQAMVDYGTIAADDVGMFFTTDSVDEAYEFVTQGLRKTWG